MGVEKIYKDARKYAIRALAALAIGGVALSIACGAAPADAPTPVPTAAAAAVPATATVVPPTATPPAPTATAIPPTPTFASAAPEWLPTALPDTPTPTAAPPTATPAPPTATPEPTTAIPAPSTATLFTTDDTTRLAAPRYEHMAAALPEGRVILSGGNGGIANNNLIVPLPILHYDVYDPMEGWSVISPEDDDLAIFFSSMVVMADGAIMIVGIGGGETEEDLIAAAAILDPDTQLWTPLPAPSTIRIRPYLALLQDGRVISVGGLEFDDDGFGFLPTRETEIFDPRTRQWQTAARTNNAKSEYMTLVAPQNGGAFIMHQASGDPDEILAEIYNPDADAWTVVSSMHCCRGRPMAVALSDGRVLVIGLTIGQINDFYGLADGLLQGNPPKVSGEIYDPTTGIWTPTGDMSGIYFSALTLLPDGRALASGGTTIEDYKGRGESILASRTEIYDPKTNAWTPGPDMAEPRFDYTATALPDGRVLIAGGITIHPDNGEIYPTDTSEIITVP